MATKAYHSIGALVRAIKAGQVPERAISPGGAARRLGVSRQRVHELIAEGKLDCWRTEDGSVILVGLDSVRARAQSLAHAA